MEALEGQKNKAIFYAKPGTTETKLVELPIEAPVQVKCWYAFYIE